MVHSISAKKPKPKPATMETPGASNYACRVAKVKTMLISIANRRPFALPRADQAEAWKRVIDDVWKTADPEFDVRQLFSTLMALPSSDKREFRYWDAEMYELRNQLVEEYARRGGDNEQVAPPSPGDAARRDPGRSDASLSEANDGEPHPKRRTSRRHAMKETVQDQREQTGEEAQDMSKVVLNTMLAEAVMKIRPHATADLDSGWLGVAVQLRKQGYTRNLTLKALKRQFGSLLGDFSKQTDDNEGNAELRVKLIQYCESAAYLPTSMQRFLQRGSGERAERSVPRPERPRRHAPPREHEGPKSEEVSTGVPEPDTQRPKRPKRARETQEPELEPTVPPANDSSSEVLLAILDKIEARDIRRSEETKELMSYLVKLHKS